MNLHFAVHFRNAQKCKKKSLRSFLGLLQSVWRTRKAKRFIFKVCEVSMRRDAVVTNRHHVQQLNAVDKVSLLKNKKAGQLGIATD